MEDTKDGGWRSGVRIGTEQGKIKCWVARKARKNQGDCIKGDRVEHTEGQGRDGNGETQRLVRVAVRTAVQDERMAQDRMEGWARGKGKAGRRVWQGGRTYERQVKRQSRADRRTQKCETE